MAREGLRELWAFAKRALLIFVILWVALFVTVYFVFGFGLILSFFITAGVSGAVAWGALELATLPKAMETEAQRRHDEDAARRIIDEHKRQGRRPPPDDV